jgi:hypothetical protein
LRSGKNVACHDAGGDVDRFGGEGGVVCFLRVGRDGRCCWGG